MIATAIAVIVIVSSAIQLGYCCYFFFRVLGDFDIVGKQATQQGGLPEFPATPVSVIICAKNERENLEKNLRIVLNDKYLDGNQHPLFEVIVVNDQSTDGSEFFLKELQQKHAHLKVVTIGTSEGRTLPGKKFALSKGVTAANHDIILMTDADCAPMFGGWISWMVFPFSYGKEIVAGYGGFYEEPGLLNKFIRSETLHTFLQYLTYNLAGLPYMAVGRNLACKKELILRAQAHPLWMETASGDDDLLIQLCATKDNMVVNVHHASFTVSEAKQTWKEWVNQKQRHFSTGKLYSNQLKNLLGGYAFSHALCWLSVLMTPFVWDGSLLMKIATGFFITRSLCIWNQLAFMRDYTSARGLKFFMPLFDFGWLLYNIIFAPFIFWKNKQQWK